MYSTMGFTEYHCTPTPPPPPKSVSYAYNFTLTSILNPYSFLHIKSEKGNPLCEYFSTPYPGIEKSLPGCPLYLLRKYVSQLESYKDPHPNLFLQCRGRVQELFSCIAIADKSERDIILSSPGGLFTSFYK
jgi:hypothetical protein